MMKEESLPYVLGGSYTEQQRLLLQALDYEPQTRILLQKIGIQPGARVVDIGCGPIGILNLLSEFVGPEGEVVGLEREPRFVEMARQEIARRGLKNVRLVQADALDTKLEKNSYDLVHERLVLINVEKREQLLSEMLSLVKPGGTLVLEDVDNISWMCEPSLPDWNVLLDALHAVHKAGGGDSFIGRRLPNILRAAGLNHIQSQIQVETNVLGQYRRTHLVSLIDSIREKIIELGLLTHAQLDQHRDALLTHLENPNTTVVDKLLVQAWGRKPG